MVRIDRNNPGKIEFFPDRPAVRFAAEQLAYYVALLTGAHPTVREAAAEPVT
ncbi:MAG: hypothetical protein H5T86_01210, partial [Armatimonadetes bacterium]|nr:hypothetical protein [Armatimonadota bacterium]